MNFAIFDTFVRGLSQVKSARDLDPVERASVISFLSGQQNPYGGYSSQSGEIVPRHPRVVLAP